MNFKQYDIVLADLNPRFGTETGKTRPVLIVQTDFLNSLHPSTIICPITTNVKQGVTILRVNIESNTVGLSEDSAIMIDQIRAIDNKRFIHKIGELPLDLIDKVEENIKIVLDL